MVVVSYEMKRVSTKGVKYLLEDPEIIDIDMKGNTTIIKKKKETIRLNTNSGIITVAAFDGNPLSTEQRESRGLKAAKAIAQ